MKLGHSIIPINTKSKDIYITSFKYENEYYNIKDKEVYDSVEIDDKVYLNIYKATGKIFDDEIRFVSKVN